MLPLKLIIEGFYSYQERQEIDFTRLTDAGLFGIFGAVGSGKSAILEAISFALYGDTERMTMKEKRAYNMLNLRSKAAFIAFEFLNFEHKKFRFEVKWNRRKNFESITSIDRSAYAWEEDTWEPLASNSASELIGLSYENFRRTIIIPQGKFKEFLELGDTARSKMMKEIFNLEAYDLQYKTSALQAANNRQIEQLHGALAGFEELSPSLLEAREQEYIQQELTLKEKYTALQQLQAEVLQLRKLQETLKELAQSEEALSTLSVQEASFEHRAQVLKQYEMAQQTFADLLQSQQQLAAEHKNLLLQLEKTTHTCGIKEQELLTLEESYTQILASYEYIPAQKEKINDLKLLIRMHALYAESKVLKERIEKATVVIDAKQAQEQKLVKHIEELEQLMEQKQQGKMDTAELLTIGQWYQQQDYQEKQKETIALKRQHIQREHKEISALFSAQKTDPVAWQQTLESERLSLKNKQEQLQQERLTLQIAKEISQYASALTEGEPCQLCGSLTHPAPQHTQDVSTQLSTLMAVEQQLETALAKLQKQAQDFQNWTWQQQHKEQELMQLDKDYEAVKQQIMLLENSFTWEKFDPKNSRIFELEKEKSASIEQELQNLVSLLKEQRIALQTVQQEIKDYTLHKQDFDKKIEAKRELFKSHKQLLEKLDFADYKLADPVSLQQEIDQLTDTISQVESAYTLLTESLQAVRPTLAREQALLESLHEQVAQLHQKIAAAELQLAERLANTPFNDLTEVTALLSKHIAVTAEREEILHFKMQVERLKGLIANLKHKADQQPFDLTLLQRKEQEYLELEHLHKILIGDYAALAQELKRLKAAFNKQKELLQEKEKLDHRAAHLHTFSNLFRSAGFVNYISTIYLQNLCEAANVRFHRLTKNQLGLRLNVETNDFEVIDYLHNGHPRSVKTLSGGQSFQASLCLALSLAESVQSLNKADKNFFFIDEGFGTQDAESINTVFETLSYLNQENRIVGIISHVEELKERIPRAITVVKDTEAGSILQFSN